MTRLFPAASSSPPPPFLPLALPQLVRLKGSSDTHALSIPGERTRIASHIFGFHSGTKSQRRAGQKLELSGRSDDDPPLLQAPDRSLCRPFEEGVGAKYYVHLAKLPRNPIPVSGTLDRTDSDRRDRRRRWRWRWRLSRTSPLPARRDGITDDDDDDDAPNRDKSSFVIKTRLPPSLDGRGGQGGREGVRCAGARAGERSRMSRSSNVVRLSSDVFPFWNTRN